jgi:hypothetical protein
MSSIGGPSGIGGPKGPGGPDGADGPDGPDGPGSADAPDDVGAAQRTSDIDVLAAEVAAGRLSPREAIDQLVEATATPDLSAAERAELRELLSEIVANDPYFASVGGRV